MIKTLGTQICDEVAYIFKTYRSEGLRFTFKKFKWKLIAVLFVYYLVRDITLYIILPGLGYFLFSG